MGTTERLTATELVDLVFDDGSFTPWDVPSRDPEPDPAYAAELADAGTRSGVDESVIVGQALLRGRRVAVVAGEFRFLGGSLGVRAATRLAAAFRRATAEGLPVLAATCSGGTRMQEGTPAFVHMVSITAAVVAHRAAGLPYLVYLRHPTTGGVFASWGSLGHVTVAEPGALVGFLGPRVYEALHGETFPSGVQRAENLLDKGIVDAVLPHAELADALDRCLRIMCTPAQEPAAPLSALTTAEPCGDAWESVQRSRNPDRPGVRRLLRTLGADVVALNGTGAGEVDPGLLLALVRAGGQSYVLLGQDRRHQTAAEPLGPGALREARRGMRLAEEMRLPLVTIIDTPGAALSVAAEEGGLAGEIARCLAGLVAVNTPTVSVIMGPGTGGGALALLPADVVLCAKYGWLSPLPPEGASVITHRSVDRAPEMAAQQRVSSADLLAAGIVDHIVDERDDAANEPVTFCGRLGEHIAAAVAHAASLPVDGRLARRDYLT